MARRVFITVAEVSGDRHAAQLVRSLKQLEPDLVIEGLGGPEMAAAGATIYRDTVNKAAMGLRGALRAGEVYRVLRWARRHFEQNRPDLWIGVDSPSMNFHFAKAAKELGIPTLQYVAPQLWAWAAWRMRKLRKWVDRVACILPFEEAYFREHGVNATFVGHPLFDELPAGRVEGPEASEESEKPAAGQRFPKSPPVIGLLPGSRKSEAQANFPGLLEAARLVREAFPDAVFLTPTTPATHPVVEGLLRQPRWRSLTAVAAPSPLVPPRPLGSSGPSTPSGAVTYALNRFDEMVPRCDLCLTVSGTATLHVAAFGVPMIVVYRVSRAIWNLAGRWLIPTRTFALVNVLAARAAKPADGPSERRGSSGGPAASPGSVVPEFVPWYGNGRPVAETAIDYLRHPEKLAAQQRQLRKLVHDLDRPGASLEVARLALGMTRGCSPSRLSPVIAF